MLRQLWKVIRTAVLVVGVLLTFFAVVEVLQAYETLRGFHPVAGWAFVGLLGLGLLWLIVWYVRRVLSRPRVLTPPKIPDRENASPRQLRRWTRYLGKFLGRLAGNPLLSAEQHAHAQAGAEKLRLLASASPSRDDLVAGIEQAESEHVEPLLKELDDQADKHVRDCVRGVMFWVALSPYKSADLLIVIYRNVRMLGDLVKVYNARPTLREQLRVFRDTLRIVATVNFLNIGRNVFESVFKALPGGRFADDIAQGIGAGFMTSVAGHAAIGRCRAFRGWSEEQARENLRAKVGDFYHDVRDIFMKDIWTNMRGRVASMFSEGGTWEKATTAVAGGLDSAGRAVNAGSKAVADGGKGIWRGFIDLMRRTERPDLQDEPPTVGQ